jgi:hypothetical protein
MKKLLLIVSILILSKSIIFAQNHQKVSPSTPEQEAIRKAEKLKYSKLNIAIDKYAERHNLTNTQVNDSSYKKIHPYIDSIQLLSYNFLGGVHGENNTLYIPKWILALKEKEYNTTVVQLRKINQDNNLIKNFGYQDSLSAYSYRYFWDYNHVYRDKYFNLKYHKTKPYWKSVNSSYLSYIKKRRTEKKS